MHNAVELEVEIKIRCSRSHVCRSDSQAAFAAVQSIRLEQNFIVRNKQEKMSFFMQISDRD